jgi:hypothetical protein
MDPLFCKQLIHKVVFHQKSFLAFCSFRIGLDQVRYPDVRVGKQVLDESYTRVEGVLYFSKDVPLEII